MNRVEYKTACRTQRIRIPLRAECTAYSIHLRVNHIADEGHMQVEPQCVWVTLRGPLRVGSIARGANRLLLSDLLTNAPAIRQADRRKAG
jgi:hypothetical protein